MLDHFCLFQMLEQICVPVTSAYFNLLPALNFILQLLCTFFTSSSLVSSQALCCCRDKDSRDSKQEACHVCQTGKKQNGDSQNTDVPFFHSFTKRRGFQQQAMILVELINRKQGISQAAQIYVTFSCMSASLVLTKACSASLSVYITLVCLSPRLCDRAGINFLSGFRLKASAWQDKWFLICMFEFLCSISF